MYALEERDTGFHVNLKTFVYIYIYDLCHIYTNIKKIRIFTNIRIYYDMKNIEHSLKIYDVVISYDFVKSKVIIIFYLPKYILRVREIFLNNFYEPIYYFFLLKKMLRVPYI